jgi:hypothetical protein
MPLPFSAFAEDAAESVPLVSPLPSAANFRDRFGRKFRCKLLMRHVAAVAGGGGEATRMRFPEEFRNDVHDEMLRHARRTVQRDWPAMRRRAGLNEALFDRSNSPLVALITRTSEENTNGRSPPLSI